MLTASASTPNMQNGENPKPAPTPGNWHGVTEGLNKARKHLSDGLYQEAVNTLKEILELAPSEPQAWSLLGEILHKHGHTGKAAACHKKASALDASSNLDNSTLPASKRLAKLLWTQGESDAARAMLALLLLRMPEDESLIEMRNTWNNPSPEAQP
ncbi:MAG: tetratricopeptide repeat protein [Mariprofundaceae bacterium]|nr:tetratricopeptide repeat protein [Mariprofundaceae bacterium]